MILDFEVEAVRVIQYLASERTNLLGELSALTLELVECRRALALALATNPVADQAAMEAAQAAVQQAVQRAELAEADLSAANQRIQQLEGAIAAEKQQEAGAMDVLTPFLNEIDGVIPAAPAPTPEPVAPEPVASEPVAETPAPDPIPDFLAPEPVAPEPVAPEPVAAEPVIEEPAAETPVVEATDPVIEVVAEEPEAPSVIGGGLPPMFTTGEPLPVMPEGTFDATPEPVAPEPVAPEAESFDNSPADPNSSTVNSGEPAPAANDSAVVGPGNEPLVP